MMGETRPLESNPGTIRGDYCVEVGRNIIHGSDSVEAAKKEVSLWFTEQELFNYEGALDKMIYEWLTLFITLSSKLTRRKLFKNHHRIHPLGIPHLLPITLPSIL